VNECHTILSFTSSQLGLRLLVDHCGVKIEEFFQPFFLRKRYANDVVFAAAILCETAKQIDVERSQLVLQLYHFPRELRSA
jgi:hypothetical protein